MRKEWEVPGEDLTSLGTGGLQGAVLWPPGQGQGGQERGSPGGAETSVGNCDPESRDATPPESPKPGGGGGQAEQQGSQVDLEGG